MAGKAEANEMKLDKINYDSTDLLTKAEDIKDTFSLLYDNLQGTYNSDLRETIDMALQKLSQVKDGLEKISVLSEKTYSLDQERERKNIYVCSPYGGKDENYALAKAHCKEVAELGHTPFASHVMLHDILDDNAGREAGLQAGLDLVSSCDELSPGMKGEIDEAMLLNIPINTNPEKTIENSKQISKTFEK